MAKLIVLSFFPAFDPPTSGGESRLLNFYRQLTDHDILLLSWTHFGAEQEEIDHASHFREIRIPKTEAFIDCHRELDHCQLGGDVSGLVCSLVGDTQTTDYQRALESNKSWADVIIHDFPYTLSADEGIGCDGLPRLYMSHNNEWRMLESYYKGPWKEYYVSYIKEKEQQLSQLSDACFYTSEQERAVAAEDFSLTIDKLWLNENGIVPPDKISRHPAEPRNVVFLGSSHQPNVEALIYIISNLAHQCPEYTFRIIGRVCDHPSITQLTCPANVKLMGFVDEEEKLRLLSTAWLAINPIVSGAGTNIKVLDYMACGVPVLTSSYGARGLGLINGVNALVAELEGFSSIINSIELSELDEIASQGRHHIAKNYSWEAIAAKSTHQIQALAERGAEVSRPLLLMLNDYSVQNYTSGGSARIKGLFSHWAATHRVVLICSADIDEPRYQKVSWGVEEHCFPWPESLHEAVRVMRGRGDISYADILAGRHLPEQSQMMAAIAELLVEADLIVLQHCYMSSVLRAFDSNIQCPVIYESHNVEPKLKSHLLTDLDDCEALVEETAALEQDAIELSDRIIAVSQSDASFYRDQYSKPVHVVENGVDIRPLVQRPIIEDGQITVVFIGSSHLPNLEAVDFIASELAPKLPLMNFVLIGSCCDLLRRRFYPHNVHLKGIVSNAEKHRLLSEAHVAINPIFTGGGSSLKLGDYFAAGLAVVSSQCGSRGYDISPDQHLLVAENDSAEAFVVELVLLARNPNLLEQLAFNAWHWANARLDWGVLVEKYRRAISGRRLLVATYRFTNPPRGGAEVYLYQLMEMLVAHFGYSIDVLSVESDTVANRYHFAAEHCQIDDLSVAPSFIDQLYRFPIQQLAEQDQFYQAKELMRLWESEWPQLFDYCRDRWIKSEFPLLLDGWYWPEYIADGVHRWTSQRARVLLPVGVQRLEIDVLAGLLIDCYIDSDTVNSKHQRSGDTVTVELERPSDHPLVLVLSAEGENIDGEVRCLGLRIAAIRYWMVDQQASVLGLDGDGEHWLATHHLDAWVAGLVHIAKNRDSAEDGRFSKLRGPVSSAMTSWFVEHHSDYDAVLVQGVPFDMPSLLLNDQRNSGVPVVLLPHYHVEDRYYHWNTFYRAMTLADRTVLAPKQTALELEKHLDLNVCALAGGGIDPGEYRDLESCAAHFRETYDIATPFILVLGRKTGSKGYQTIIEAYRLARQSLGDTTLVMIGPDEDGIAINEPGVSYLGALSREDVKGALACCTLLTSMSNSESFGLVVVEAWMASKPVIANRTNAAFRELIDDGQDGLLIEGQVELAEAFSALIDNPSLRDQMASMGRQKANSDYSWKSLAAGFDGIFSELTSKNQGLPTRR